MPAQLAALPESRLEESPTDAEPACVGLNLGFRDYEESLRIQDRIVARRKDGTLADCLLFVDYPPIITLGRAGREITCWRGLRSSVSAASVSIRPVAAGILPTMVPDKWWPIPCWI